MSRIDLKDRLVTEEEEEGETKRGLANVAKIAKVTRILLAN